MGLVRDGVRETKQSLSTVFRNRALRRLNLAFAGSLTGDWAYATAVAVWAFGVGGATAVGVFAVVRLASIAIVTPVAATLADRFPRRLVMMSSDVVRAVLLVVAAALVWKDAPPWTVYVVAVLAAIAGAPFRPSLGAILPSLVRTPAELTAANGTLSTLESVTFFVGPAIGGLLLAVAEVEEVFLFNAVTFVWSFVMLLGVRPPAGAKGDPDPSDERASDGDEEKVGFLTESTAGFRSIWANRDLLVVVTIYCAQTIVAGASFVFVVSVAVDLVDLGPQGVGYLDATLGVGAIIGGFVAIARASRHKLSTDFGIGVLLWALPLLLVAVWPEAAAAFAAMFLIGMANPVVDVNATTIVQRLTPDAVLGRVFGALEAALIGTMALGSLLMPLLIATVGLRWGVTVIAALVLVVVVPWFGRLRRLDETLREPEGVALLREVPLFAPLSTPVLERLARQLVRVEAPAGTTVIREGDPGDRFYVIESGRVEATFQGARLSEQGPGEPFGEIALLHDVPRTATVTALEDTVLQALERDDFLVVLSGDDEARNRAEDLVSRRIPTV